MIFKKLLDLNTIATQTAYFVKHLRDWVAEVWQRETCSR